MMSVKQTFKLYDVVNKHFQNGEDAKILVSEIEEIMDNKVDLKMTDFATRQDLNELQLSFSDLRAETSKEINELQLAFSDLRLDFNTFRSETSKEINDLRISFNDFRAEIRKDIAEFKTTIKQDFSNLWSSIKEDHNDLKYKTEQNINDIRLEVSNLSVRMEQGFKDQLKWTIVIMVSFLSIMIGITKFL